jgi:heme/copper-type cytochrome/quinol oxidase subunit 1
LQEYYVIREYLLPGWLMAVQTFVTLAFIDTFVALGIMACEVCRYPLKFVLRYEWLLTTISFVAVTASAVFLFFGVLIFGVNAYRRDWLMYPKFNVISWSFAFAVVAMFFLALAGLILYKDAKFAYERRRESKNLVQQMQMHETASIPSTHSRGIHGYI